MNQINAVTYVGVLFHFKNTMYGTAQGTEKFLIKMAYLFGYVNPAIENFTIRT